MRLSVFVSAFVAVLVGFAGSVAVVLSAADALGATAGQKATWVSVLCLAIAASTLILSVWSRQPIVTAWSTPGAAVLATTAGVGMETASAAFLFAAILVVITGLVPWLERLVSRLPGDIAAAMLAGVLFAFVVEMVLTTQTAPALALPLIVVFLALRTVSAVWAVLAVVILGVALAFVSGSAEFEWTGSLAPFGLISMRPDIGVLLGVGLPLYLVTMASQNLPGMAVLRADGYDPPGRLALLVTGGLSAVSAPFGAHTTNLAAITAAICTGPDAHPDPARRWLTGPIYALGYLLIATSAMGVVALVAGLPAALIAIIAGTALLNPFMASLGAATTGTARGPALITFAVTASGLAIGGIGAAFWGLVAGLCVLVLERALTTLRR